MGRAKVKKVGERLDQLAARLGSVPHLAWLVGAVLMAAALRLPALGQQSLWVDEGHTYIWMTMPLDDMLGSLLAGGDEVPLYYALMWFWAKAFGTSEFALRLPSVWFALANVAAAYRLGRLSGEQRIGTWAGLAVAVNPFLVWYSREARPYAMILLLVTAVTWSFVRVLQRPKRRHWIALILLSGTAYLTHYITLAMGFVQLVVFLVTFRKSYPAFRRWVPAQTIAALPVVSWFASATVLHGFTTLRGTWIPEPSWMAPLGSLWNFSIGYDGHLTPYTLLALFPFVVSLVAALGLDARRFWSTSVLTWLVLPIASAFILSAGIGPSYLDRYLSICVPAYLLLVVAGLSTVRWSRLRGVFGAWLLVAMTAASFGVVVGRRCPKPSWRSAVSHVLNESREGDRLLVDAKGLFVTFYYAGYRIPIERVEPDHATAALDDGLESDGRIWFLYRDPTESIHVLDRVRRFDPYASGDRHIAAWLESHAGRIKGEWFPRGLYLALLE